MENITETGTNSAIELMKFDAWCAGMNIALYPWQNEVAEKIFATNEKWVLYNGRRRSGKTFLAKLLVKYNPHKFVVFVPNYTMGRQNYGSEGLPFNLLHSGTTLNSMHFDTVIIDEDLGMPPEKLGELSRVANKFIRLRSAEDDMLRYWQINELKEEENDWDD